MTRNSLNAVLVAAIAAVLVAIAVPNRALASGDAAHPPSIEWQYEGPFGTFDRGAIRRGMQVYQEVCASCHSLEYVAFRTLASVGFSEDEIKSLAEEYSIVDGPDDEGEMFERPGLPSDTFVAPFANEKAARASNSGAYPPDLSLMVKARPGGADYLYAMLIGYEEEPDGFELGDGMSYNPFFAGSQIAMPEPLYEDAVEYADGTAATPEQMAQDLTVFLAWTAEPEMEERKRMGVKVMIFLLIMTVLLAFVMRQVWADVH